MKIIEHYNDEKMTFNDNNKQYELTIETVKENFEIPFRDDGVLSRRIAKNSTRIYNYIFRMSNSKNHPLIKKLLNETQEGRNFLYDVLLSQIEADLTSGFNSIGSQPLVDLKTGKVISTDEIISNGLISVDTKLIIESSNRYFEGINILSAAKIYARY